MVEVRGRVATATEIVPGAHDGSANPADFSVFVRSYAREVLLASSGLADSGNETHFLSAHVTEDFAEFSYTGGSSIMGTLIN